MKQLVIVRNFQRAVLADIGRSVEIRGLCAEIGVPERTLRRYCQIHLGMSPVVYRRHKRLERARSALQAHEGSVTEVSLRFGFEQLGKFAALYRRAYGEAPSETLARV